MSSKPISYHAMSLLVTPVSPILQVDLLPVLPLAVPAVLLLQILRLLVKFLRLLPHLFRLFRTVPRIPSSTASSAARHRASACARRRACRSGSRASSTHNRSDDLETSLLLNAAAAAPSSIDRKKLYWRILSNQATNYILSKRVVRVNDDVGSWGAAGAESFDGIEKIAK